MSKRIVVTSPPPTTNGDLHLGHLSGPYLGADVYVRAQRLFGHQAVHLVSTDDHQSYVVTKAMQEGRTPEETIADYAARIQHTLGKAQIVTDCFTSPRRPEHIRRAQDFFLQLYQNGTLQVVEEPTCYCEVCNHFLFEAHVKGKCSHCLTPSGGNYCEACGHPNEPAKLLEPQCTTCGTQPVIRPLQRIVLPLEKFRQPLVDYYNRSGQTWRPHLRELLAELLAKSLPDVPVTNLTSWGIPVPLPEFAGHVLNVWFEMVPGHLETAHVWATEQGLAEDVWHADSNAHIVQFFGFDNSFYYAVMHPVLLLASGARLADGFIPNEFYLLQHEKFSTSRRHVIWGSDFLDEQPSDWVRYHLSLTAPEFTQTNFSTDEYRQTVTERFDAVWVPFLQNGFALAERVAPGIEASQEAHGLIAKFADRFQAHYDSETFTLRGAAQALHEYVGAANELLQQSGQPADAYVLLRALSIFAAPILTNFGRQLWRYAGGTEQPLWSALFAASQSVKADLAGTVWPFCTQGLSVQP